MTTQLTKQQTDQLKYSHALQRKRQIKEVAETLRVAWAAYDKLREAYTKTTGGLLLPQRGTGEIQNKVNALDIKLDPNVCFYLGLFVGLQEGKEQRRLLRLMDTWFDGLAKASEATNRDEQSLLFYIKHTKRIVNSVRNASAKPNPKSA